MTDTAEEVRKLRLLITRVIIGACAGLLVGALLWQWHHSPHHHHVTSYLACLQRGGTQTYCDTMPNP